ncbi:MAG TPA: radical SAM protein [Anaerolineae bacterium]|nr:radical SAM protein [Anaerolineae bacterium]
MKTKGQVLLLNPWIYDFAAYNLWIEPLGLLTIAAALRDNGYAVTVIDCLAPHPSAPRPRPDGSGKFFKTGVEKPEPIAFIPRRYGRYGLPLDQFDVALKAAPIPDVVMVASGMTYWYPGAVEAIRRVRAQFGSVPVALGGVYATLCPDHARRHSGADRVFAGPGVAPALRLADEVTGHDSDPGRYADPRIYPSPAHVLVPRPFAGIITSWGCPYRCTYCASHRLQPTFVRRELQSVVEEIAGCVPQGIQDLAFYDDALLLDAARHLVPILQGVLDRGLRVRFHTPNGLHAREITRELAFFLRRAGLATVRLSLETVDPVRQRATGAKVDTAAFAQGVTHLQAAGFGAREVGAYILAGLPGQPLEETEATVQFVQRLGVQAKLALFSPIPGTPDGDRALPHDADPLLHNNTVFPYLQGDDHVRELQRIKQLAKDGNAALIRDVGD